MAARCPRIAQRRHGTASVDRRGRRRTGGAGFNKSYREEILDAYFFESVEEVQQLTDQWLLDYNDYRTTTRSEVSLRRAICRGPQPGFVYFGSVSLTGTLTL